jgi:flagellar biosynthesis protein FlhG
MMTRHPTLTAIASGKGGTGKTFIAVTLAHALSYEGERVLLFDGDLGLSNVAVQLGLTVETPFAAVLAGEIPPHDAAIPFAGGAQRRGGFDILAGPPGSGMFVHTSRGDTARLLAGLKLTSGYDRVILDLGAGVGDDVMRFSGAADQTILVVTPDPAALTDAYAFVKLHAQRHRPTTPAFPAPAFLVNQASTAEARAVAQALTGSCRSFLNIAVHSLGTVRRDPKVVDAVRHQQPLPSLHKECGAAHDIVALAGRLSQAHRSRLQDKVALR